MTPLLPLLPLQATATLFVQKNSLSRGPRAPTFIRSSAFTLLPWISSMQNGCSRDHRDIEEGWAAEGRSRPSEQRATEARGLSRVG